VSRIDEAWAEANRLQTQLGKAWDERDAALAEVKRLSTNWELCLSGRERLRARAEQALASQEAEVGRLRGQLAAVLWPPPLTLDYVAEETP